MYPRAEDLAFFARGQLIETVAVQDAITPDPFRHGFELSPNRAFAV